MSSPQHLVVHPGKAEADAPEQVSSFFGHVDALRSDQIQLNCKLVGEKVANCQARNALDFSRLTYERVCQKKHQAMKDLMDKRLEISQAQAEASELEKVMKEETDYILKLEQRLVELHEMNQEMSKNLRKHLNRVACFHERLSGFVSCMPVARESDRLEEELTQLKNENQKLKVMTARYDVRLIEEAKEGEEERRRLELSVAEAKARLVNLQNRLTQNQQTENQSLQQLKAALEVQHATNDAVEAEIQAKERQLFGAELGSDWPEL